MVVGMQTDTANLEDGMQTSQNPVNWDIFEDPNEDQ